MHKVLHKKVHFGFALMLILALGTVPAVFSVALMVDPVPEAEAIIGQDASLEIVGVPIPCRVDAPLPTCLGSCKFCGTYAGTCASMSEIQVRALNPKTLPLLEKTQALCLTKPAAVRPPNGGSFHPGARCVGKILRLGPFHQLFNFGCYK